MTLTLFPIKKSQSHDFDFSNSKNKSQVKSQVKSLTLLLTFLPTKVSKLSLNQAWVIEKNNGYFPNDYHCH